THAGRLVGHPAPRPGTPGGSADVEGTVTAPHRAFARALRHRRPGGRSVRLPGAVLAVALAAVAACGGEKASSGVLTADVARVTPGPDAPVDEVVAGLEAFGLRAEEMLAAEGGDGAGNTVLSPASIGIAFAMAQGGARGDTEQRIAEVFGFPAQPGLHRAMNELTAQLDAVAGRDAGEAGSDGEEVVLDLADAVWLQRDFPFEDAYLDLLGRHYGAGLHTADFRSDPEAGRRAI